MRRDLALRHGAFERLVGRFIEGGVLTEGDALLVDALAPRFAEDDAEVLWALAFAVRAPRAGHVGVDLRRLPDRIAREQPMARAGAEVEALAWPSDLASWEAKALASSMVDPFGGPPRAPFVAQAIAGEHLIMTRRMAVAQRALADGIGRLVVTRPADPVSDARADAAVARLFPDAPDGQGARALRRAAAARLTVITGGPGTGKTFSIKRLLAMLFEAAADAGDAAPRVALAAPTGKAAVRMAEAMGEGLAALPVGEEVRALLGALRPQTLHKLLGIRPDGTSRHGAERPVAADVVVVDEASMVDLALMRLLVDAVPDGARLILLGDRDQLASVEAGTVLADIVSPALEGDRAGQGAPARASLAEAVVPFTQNYRFSDAPEIAAIAEAIQASRPADSATAFDLLTSERHADAGSAIRVRHLGRSREGRPRASDLDTLAAPYLDGGGFVGALATMLRGGGVQSVAGASDSRLNELLVALERYRVLAVHRRGPLGVRGLLRALELRVRAALERALSAERGATALPSRDGQWLGRPLLVRENAYDVGLMNGDVGLVLPREGRLAAVFRAFVDGQWRLRSVDLSRVPAHEGALVMTVHKSQGSQFEHVALVLAGRSSPIQTRELIYTAITRARRRLDWYGAKAELRAALDRPVARASGLGALLWGSTAEAP